MEKLIDVYDDGIDGRNSRFLRTVSIPEEHIIIREQNKWSTYVSLTDYGMKILGNKLKGYSYGFLSLKLADEKNTKQRIKYLQSEIEKLQIELNDLLKHQH